MLVIAKVLGNLRDVQADYSKAVVDYVDIEWHETHKKIHKKMTASGVEIGIRLDDHILVHGLKQDDVLYNEEGKVIAVNVPPCDTLVIEIDNPYMIPKVCYEIGNKHMPFFRSEKDNVFVTPYDKPLEVLLEKLEIKTTHTMGKLDFTRAISTSLGGHHH